MSPSRHVSHVPPIGQQQPANIIGPDSNFKYANKIIRSSSSVSLSIISDGSFVHFLVSAALMIEKYFKSFFGVKIIYLHQVLEQGRRSYYPLISLSSVYLWYLGARLSLAVYSVSSAGAKFRSLELHKLSKVTNSIHNYIHSVCHHPTKLHIVSSKCRRVGNLNKMS